MPKMTHAIEGWALGSSPRAAGSKGLQRRQAARHEPEPTGLWKYQTLRRSWSTMVFSILFSLSLHALVFLGFNDPVPPKIRIIVDDEPIIQLTMPELEKDEIDPVEALGDEQEEETPGISVPMLADLPSLVPINSFVQPLDFTPALPTNLDSVQLSAIPVNIARNSGAAERLGRIFNIAELDRQPQPIFQPSPVFPPEMKSEYQVADVEMGFIINTKGEVLRLIPISVTFYPVVIARCAKRAVAIQLDCFVASLLAMTEYFHRAIGIIPIAPSLWTLARQRR